MDRFEINTSNKSYCFIMVIGADNNLSFSTNDTLAQFAETIQDNSIVICLVDYAEYAGQSKILEISQSSIRTIQELGEINSGDPEVIQDFLNYALQATRGIPHTAIGFRSHGTGAMDDAQSAIAFEKLNSYFEQSLNRVHLDELKSSEEDWADTLQMKRKSSFWNTYNSVSVIHPDNVHPFWRKVIQHDTLIMIGPDKTSKDFISNEEIKEIFSNLERENSIQSRFPLDIVFCDTCANGMVEVIEQFGSAFSVFVASEEYIEMTDFPYSSLFSSMQVNPPINAQEWAKQILSCYSEKNCEPGSSRLVTISAFNPVNEITHKFKKLVTQLGRKDPFADLWVREAAEKSTNFNYGQYEDSRDMVDFLKNLKNISSDIGIKNICEEVIVSIERTRVGVVACGQEANNTNGLAIWIPLDQSNRDRFIRQYRNLDFNKITGWSDYIENIVYPENS